MINKTGQVLIDLNADIRRYNLESGGNEGDLSGESDDIVASHDRLSVRTDIRRRPMGERRDVEEPLTLYFFNRWANGGS